MSEVPEHLEQTIKSIPEYWDKVHREISKRILGQEELISKMLVAVFASGHCLLTGVPGLAKTLLVQTFSEIANLNFKRIQFTPDMMPSDITGTELLEEDPTTKERKFKFMPGPVFTQLLLADEINRTPPKTQAALLESMQEHHVTVAGKKYKLKEPFFVLATQNPIEQEGTYPLPEAQLDRFMFSLFVNYPSPEDEVKILLQTTSEVGAKVQKVIDANDIIEVQNAIRYIMIPKSVAEFIVRLVATTRPGGHYKSSIVDQYVRWGAGPRASQYLALAGKVYAALDGRFNVSFEDIEKAVKPVLRHRVILNYHAEADRKNIDDVLIELLHSIKK